MNGPWDRYKSSGPWDNFTPTAPDESSAETRRLSAHRPSNDFLQQQEMESMGQAWRDLMQGGKSTLDRAALGVKELFPQSVQDAGDAIDRYAGSGGLTRTMAAMRPKSGHGVAGALAMDVALGAAPVAFGGAATVAAARALGGSGGALTAATGDVLGSAGYGLASTPENREEAALYGGLGAGAGHVLAKTIQSLPRAAPDFVRGLESKGIHPTIGQASHSRRTLGSDIVGYAENALADVPLTGFGINRHLGYGKQQLEKALLKDPTGLELKYSFKAPGLAPRDVVPADVMRGTAEAIPNPALGRGIGAAALGISGFLHLQGTALVAALVNLGYLKPAQAGMVKMLVGTDTLAQAVQKNPQLIPMISAATGRQFSVDE